MNRCTPHRSPIVVVACHRLARALLLTACAAPAIAPARDLVEIAAPALHGAWLVPSDPAHAADSHRTTAYLVILAAERDNEGVPGLAHYAEHLVWQSTTSGMTGLGGAADANAVTNRLTTTYFLDAPDGELDRMLATLARAFEPIDLPQRYMREELGIVEREYHARYGEDVADKLWREVGSAQFDDQWPAREASGTPESIGRLTPEMAKRWQARTHRPGNAVLLLHGSASPDALAKAIGRAFGESPAADALAHPDYVPGPSVDTVLERTEPRIDAALVLHSRAAPLRVPVPEPADLDARLTVLRRVLDSTRPGGLIGPLRFDDFVAASLDMSVWSTDDAHVELRLEARPDRGITSAALLRALRTTLADIGRTSIPDASVARARQLSLDELDALERPDLAVLDAARDSIADGLRPESLAAWRARLEAVTTRDVNALMRTLVDAPRVVSLMAQPGETP